MKNDNLKRLIKKFKAKTKKESTLKLKFFINKLISKNKNSLDKEFKDKDKEVWAQTNCLECSNCCKVMTPTFTSTDIKRISVHLKMEEEAFKKKWLRKEKSSGDWINIASPCQFLDTKTNHCTIYEIRPTDCAEFPHHHKKHLIDYAPMLKQNVDYCPATHLLIEKIYINSKGQREL